MSHDIVERESTDKLSSEGPMIKTALVGYGFSSQTFHVPFLTCLSEYSLCAVSSSKAEQVKAAFPDVEVYASAEQLIDHSDADLVIITAPNNVHYALAKYALESGKHVVIEKPVVTNSADGEVLIALARKFERQLTVYHNRRWDGDFLTVKKLLEQKRLGQVRLFESHFDRLRPVVRQRWRELPGDGSGILFDLGPHLIDQALHLFGLPLAVTAQCRCMREGAASVDFFHLVLHYDNMEAILQSSPYSASPNARFNVQGDVGQYVVYGLDPQEERLKNGGLPVSECWSREMPDNYGKLYTNGIDEIIVTEHAGYETFYRQLARAIWNGGAVPVDPMDAVLAIKIIELAMQSSERGCTIEVSL